MKKITFFLALFVCLLSYGQELITDPSFEGSSTDPLTASSSPWKASGINIAVQGNSSNANSGDKYVNVGVNNSSNTFLYQQITTEASTTYTLTLSYRMNATEEVSLSPLVSIRRTTFNGEFVMTNNRLDGSVATTWLKETYTFTTGVSDTSVFFTFVRPSGGAVVRVDDISIRKTSTWDGSDSSDWATAANWDNNAVPTSETIVNIPASVVTNEPTVSSSTGAAAYDLTINAARTLTVEAGGSLIVSGTSTGNVTYNRTLTSKPADADGWHLVSSPVAGEVFDNDYATNNSIASGSGSNLGIATYSSGWTYLQSPSGSISSTSGVGYSMKRSADGTVGFTGTINTADVNGVAVSASASDFVLLGVPYTAYMSSKTFLEANTNLDQSQIWVWEQGTTGGNYIVGTALADDFILAPGQGFFVKKATTGNTVNFAESNQQANADTFKKSSRTEVKILMNDGINDRFAKMYYLNNVTKGYDLGYEGETFGGVETNFDIFSHLVAEDEGKKYQVQSLPISEMESTIVPLGLKVGADQEVTISAETLNLPTGLKVYIEDRLTNIFTRLDEANSNYKVQVASGTTEGRFYLHTNSEALSTDTALLNSISIYKLNATTLRIVGLQDGKASVKLFNLLGKQVMTSNFNTTGVKELTLPNLSMGVYIVQLETVNGKLNKKIVLE